MIKHLFKHKRRVGGKVIKARLYSGRYKLDGDIRPTTVHLNTTDKQVAQKKLDEIVIEKEREAAGFLEPKLIRDSVIRPLSEHVTDFINDLRTRGRDGGYRTQWRSG